MLSKEVQFMEIKSYPKMADWEWEKERKQKHTKILAITRYLDPESGFTLLDLSFTGKDSVFLRSSMAALHLSLPIFSALACIQLFYSHCKAESIFVPQLNTGWFSVPSKTA